MVEGLRDALQYITGLKEKSMEPKIVEIEGSTYCTRDLVRYHQIPYGKQPFGKYIDSISRLH